MSWKAASILLFTLSATSASAAVEVTFRGGGSLTAETIEYRDGLAVLTLPGGGMMAVEAGRILSAVTMPLPEPSLDPAAPEDPPTAGDRPSIASPEPATARPDTGSPAAPPAGADHPSAPDLPALIQEAARRHDVDAELLRCLIEVESGYDPRAVSPKGAMGLAQLMPGTARDLGVRDPFDPAEAVDAAARHLKGLLDQSGGRFVPALAAYNAGQGVVGRYGGLPPYTETIRYIERILQRYAAE